METKAEVLKYMFTRIQEMMLAFSESALADADVLVKTLFVWVYQLK